MSAVHHTHRRPIDRWLIRLAAYAVGLNGVLILLNILLIAVRLRPHSSLHYADIVLPILIGLTLVYVSSLLARHKRAAWNVTVPVYFFVLGSTTGHSLAQIGHHMHYQPLYLLTIFHGFVLPVLALSILVYYRDAFVVRSDVGNFKNSLRFIGAIFILTALYGVIGFLLLDKHDFHQEISPWGAFHHTIDQFNLTTGDSLVPYTKRADLFLESLTLVSAGAIFYAVISLFQPIRAHYSDQSRNRKQAAAMLELSQTASSEDIFKIWPHDKSYFLSADNQAGFAYKVRAGVALIVGDPMGSQAAASRLWPDFADQCRLNDWLPAFIHTEPDWNNFYKKHHFSLQKIGEEAVVDLAHFDAEVRRNKYFRHIQNKFTKQGYSCEMLQPPHSSQTLQILKTISDQWLEGPGRSERGFMMGYASDAYFQQNAVAAVRDDDGTICAFMNQVTSYNSEEANFDLLRHRKGSPGNINDFLLLAFMQYAAEAGFKRINLGLCPLSGMEESVDSSDSKIIDTALQFAYSNGDRLYSFSGLRRFKTKYEPDWQDRYIAYQGGIRGFTRTINSLNRAMQLPKD